MAMTRGTGGSTNGLATADLGTKFTDYTATSASANQEITLSGAALTAKYLYFIPGPDGTNNDHLVWKADIAEGGGPPTEVPTPATLVLVASASRGLA